MNINTTIANPLINDMLQRTSEALEGSLRNAIESQLYAYHNAKQDTFRKVLGNCESSYSLVQHFKYQATIGQVLREMESSYLELFGKPWDFVEPVAEEPVTLKRKRGRPRKD
jgi:hypothetical protein